MTYNNTPKLAVFPGTFDPPTLGHFDIIKRAHNLFDEVLVAVANNPSKHTLISLEDRIEMIKAATFGMERVKVEGFSGLLVDFLKDHGARVLVRGVRTVADYDYEIQLTGMYRTMMPELEIVMFPTSGNLSFISSTLVREVIIHQGDTSSFVPPAVASIINRKYLHKS